MRLALLIRNKAFKVLEVCMPLFLVVLFKVREYFLMIDICTKLKKLRIAHGLTREELATKSGIANDKIGRIERGEIRVTTDDLIRIAHGLGKSPDTLMETDLGNTTKHQDTSQLVEKIVEKLEKIFLENNLEFNADDKAKLISSIYQKSLVFSENQRLEFITSLMSILSFILERAK